MTPSAPTALAVLMIVPTLPGLPGECSATNSESGAHRQVRRARRGADRTIAARPDGPSRSAIRPNSSPDSRATRTPAASCAATIAAAPGWRSRSGATISTSISAPASTACHTGWMPCTTNADSRRLCFRSASAATRLTSGFAALLITSAIASRAYSAHAAQRLQLALL